MRTRRNRAEISEQHRRDVLDAAHRAFLEKGYHGASLDAIAQDAGFSKGVVYSQFGSKDDLFLALLAERIDERRRSSERRADDVTGSEGFVDVARDAIGVTADTLAWQIVLLEFRAHAARHPATLERYTELHELAIAGTAEILAGIFERAGTTPPLPPRMLAVIFLTVGTGLAAELLTDPELDARAISDYIAEGLVARAGIHT
jgi:AcrR family transcriptional regulator